MVRNRRWLSAIAWTSLCYGQSATTGALTGWTLAGIVIVQGGLPMTLSDPSAGGVYGHTAPATVTLCPGASYAGLGATHQ